MPPEISIIVPVFNEADNVLPLVSEITTALRDERRTIEIVLVDDASTDETWRKIMAANTADARVRGLKHGRNAGQSAALWTGFRNTHSPVIATLDGDRQNDPADLPRLIAGLDQSDLVCGVRLNRQDGFRRRASSKIARAFRKAFLGVDFRDTGCCLRAFKRPVLERLFEFNGFHRFMPILVHGGGARVSELPVNHRPRVAGVSKYGIWNRMGRGLVDLFAVAWYQKRRIRPVPITEFPPST